MVFACQDVRNLMQDGISDLNLVVQLRQGLREGDNVPITLMHGLPEPIFCPVEPEGDRLARRVLLDELEGQAMSFLDVHEANLGRF